YQNYRRSLDAQFRLAVHFRQVILENRLRYEDGREHVGDQTNGQRHGEAPNRAGAKDEQEKGRNHGSDVGVDNRQKGLAKPGLDRRCWRLAVARFLADTLKDEHVGVYAHTDGQDDTGDTRQRQHGTKHGQRRQKNEQVQDQSQHSVNAGEPIIKDHEDHDHQQAQDGRAHAVANGVRPERRANRALFKILDRSRKRASAQHQGEVVRGFLAEVPVNASRILDAALDHRRRIDLLFEHDSHLTAAILFGEWAKAPRRFTG